MTRARPLALLSLLALAVLAFFVLPARAQQGPIRWIMPAADQTNVWPAHRIGLEFDRDMDRASVEAALSVEPPVDGHLEWRSSGSRRIELVPHDLHTPGQTYQVEVAAGVKDALGNVVLTTPYRWSFTAGDPSTAPRFSAAPPVLPLSPAGGRDVPIQPGYPRATFELRLYAISDQEFAAYYKSITANGQPHVDALDPVGLDTVTTWRSYVNASAGPAYVPLPLGTLPGFYLLEADHEHLAPARTLLVYSDYALAAKTGRHGLLAWVSSIPHGTSAPGAAITAFDEGGDEVGDALADDDGVVHFADRGEAEVLVADVAGHPAAVALDGWWYSDNAYYSIRRHTMKAPLDVVGHAFTDRPIYRPGHTVHWKTSLRRVTGEGMQPLAPTEPVTVTIKDASGNAIQQTSHHPDTFGSVHGELALGDEVGLGDWRFEVRAAGRTVTGRFKVEEYVKPDFEVEVTTDEPYYIRGDSARLTVQADYYFGQPVAGGEVTVRVYDNRYWTRASPLIERAGTLDATGGFDLVVDLPLRPESDGTYRSQSYTAEAEVVDSSRRPVYSTADIPVHPADLALSIGNRRYGVSQGQPLILDLVTRLHDGQPAPGRLVEVAATRSYWRGEPTVTRAASTTDASGRATLSLEDLDVGWYRIVATTRDDFDREARAQSYAWVSSRSYPWYYSGNLDIDADRESYEPGDTALLLIRSPITTTALVTLENDEVEAERVVDVVGATSVEIPITDDMAPGVTARVVLWEPMDPGTSSYSRYVAEGRLIAATTRIVVPADDKRLSVAVVPDSAEAGPGDTVGITLRVSDSEGRPVVAQVALALVDKAVLALAQDPNGDIYDAFWRYRTSTVNTHDSQRLANWYVRYEYDRSRRYYDPPSAPGTPAPGSPTASPAPSATAAAGDPKDQDEASQAQPRREFPDTAYWNAAIVTDGAGEARVSLVLPDSLTTWQALARAIDFETRVGQGSAEVLVSKPVIADPAMPRFAVQGDSFVLDVLARNYATTETISGTCSLDSPGLIQLNYGKRDLDLPFNETRVARWSVVAADVGTHEQTAWLHTPVGGDGIALPLEVQPFVVPERFARSGAVIDDPVTEAFTVPFEAHPDSSTVEVRLTPSLAAGILEGLEGLIGYPYGCVEQTMSRMLPNAIVGRLILELDIVAPHLTERLHDVMLVGLQKLYGFQHSDGSWGWWRSGGNTYITAYVLQGLLASKEAGHPVDEGVMARGFSALERQLRAEPNQRTRAYALYVLTEADRADSAAALATYEQRSDLDAFAMGALALALHAAGHGAEADQAVADMKAMVDETSATAHWPRADTPGRWSYWSWRTMSSNTKNTAMALLVLSRLEPDSPLAPKAVRWLMGQRQGPYWGRSTHDTAWSVLALTDWIVASGELWATYDWQLTLDGVEVAAGRHESDIAVSQLDPVVISGELLSPGDHTLRFEKTGDGTLYYAVVGRLALYHPDFEPVAADGSGVTVSRDYMPIEGRAGTDGWRAGDLINVRLTLRTSQELHYVIAEDMLPAGFEAVNTALDTETNRLPSGERPWWRWWGYERREIRDDKVTFFASWLRSGTHTFEYAARAVTPGRFAARPAEVYAMYRPDVWGRSASKQVSIATKQVAERPPLPGDFDRDCRLTGFDAALVAADWGSRELRRDVTGDGRLDAADIATADGRSGLDCGDSVPLPAGPAGAVQLRLVAPDSITQGEEFDLAIDLADPALVGAWELSLDMPQDGFDVVGVSQGEALGAARTLGPVSAPDGAVRLGGYAPGGMNVAAGETLAVVRLRPRRTGDSDIAASAAQIVRPDGGSYEITVDGAVVSPEPWTPTGQVWLPRAVRLDQ